MGTKDLQILEIGRENFFIFKKTKTLCILSWTNLLVSKDMSL